MKPESWDESRGVRQYWWLLPPVTFALILYGFSVVRGGGSDGASNTFSDEVAQEYALGETPSIAIDNVTGSVTVTRKDGPVRVTVKRTGLGKTRDEAFDSLGRLQLEMAADGDTLTIRTGEFPVKAPRTVRAEVRVTAPEGAEVDIATGGGDVKISGIRGHVGAFTGKGDIDLLIDAASTFRIQVSGRKFRSTIPLDSEAAPSRSAYRGHAGEAPKRVIKLSSPNGTINLAGE